MNTTVRNIIAGATLFGAGVWAGQAFFPGTVETESARRNHGLNAFATAIDHPAVTTRESGLTTAGKLVRPFKPGRPFEPGQAKAWLLACAADLKAASEDATLLIYADLAQVFFTMDEESAMEAVTAIREIIALKEANDPEIKQLLGGDDLGRRAHFAAIFRLAQLNPEAALEMSKDTPDGHWRGTYNMAVIARLAAQNPARAEAMMTTLQGKERNAVFELMLQSMARSDPAAALALAEKYPADVGDKEWKEIHSRLARMNPQQGMEAAAKTASSGRGTEPLRSAMGLWLGRDPAAAKAWLDQYQGAGRAAAAAELIVSQASTNPDTAATAFAKLQTEVADQMEVATAATAIAKIMAERDLPSAQSWLTGLKEGGAKDKAVQTVAEFWVRSDTEAASRWIATLPAGAGRDGAAVALVEAIKHRDPAAAFAWARSIQGGQMRYIAGHVIHIWRDRDPEAADAAARLLSP